MAGVHSVIMDANDKEPFWAETSITQQVEEDGWTCSADNWAFSLGRYSNPRPSSPTFHKPRFCNTKTTSKISTPLRSQRVRFHSTRITTSYLIPARSLGRAILSLLTATETTNSRMSLDQNLRQKDRVTWEGCSVLLDINDGDRFVFARLLPDAKLKIGKENCSLNPLIGSPFGSVFRAESGKNGPYLSPISQDEQGNDVGEKDDDFAGEELRDNRKLVDNNTAQSLTSEDIETMRREGATGDEILKALIANSATFEKKTAFSQEKYMLRKQKKYAPRVLVRRPFARSICEAYFKKHPANIGFLRVDTLSLLLTMGNVTANSDILVLDMVGGLITGAVAERSGGSGYVCNTFLGTKEHTMDIVRIFNLSEETCKRVVRCSLDKLCPAQNGICEEGKAKTTCKTSEETTEQLTTGDSSTCQVKEEDTIASVDETSEMVIEQSRPTQLKACKSVKAGKKAPEELIKSWREKGFSSLIVAAPELSPWTIAQKLLPLLSNSAPFAIYHQHLQPLATCMHNLQMEKMALGLQIMEPWLREYQVLPSRTHPCMRMSAFGGYILSGIRIGGCDETN